MEQVRQAFSLQNTPGTSPAQIKETNIWLEKFQNTQEAWQVADQLLAEGAPEGNGAAAARPEHIFAAQTMRVKIQYDWAELPPAQHTALRNSLLQHVLRFGQGPLPVLRQLCLAVGVLALHMEEWHATVVTDLITSLTQPPESAAAKLPCLLELLLVLPEEAENYKVNVVPRRRDNFRSMLSAHSTQVLMLLHQVCAQFQAQASAPAGVAVLTTMMKCLSSWMHYVAPENRQFQDTLASLPLIPFGFSALAHKELFDAASDLVVETIHFAADCEASHELVPKVLPSVLNLVGLYDAAVAAEDEDSAKAYCRIFTEAGEQFLNVLLKSPKDWALPAAQAILRGARHPEPEVAEITFNFWYLLSEQVAGGGRMLPDEEKPEVKALFAPLFLEVVEALRELVELPDDSDTWGEQDHDDFKRFRYAVGDAIFDSCKVATSVAVITKLSATLQAKLPEFAAAPEQHWRGIEGCVYCLRQSISSNDPTFFQAPAVASLLQLLPTLPVVGQLQSTAIRTVGTYSNWLSKNPQLLPPLLTFVSNGLRLEATAAASSQAMKLLCDSCAEHLAEPNTMQQLLQMYLGTLQLPLAVADRVDLVAALAFVVSQMELEQILPAMQAIAQPLLERLTTALQSGSSTAAEVAVSLEQLCALLRGVTPARGCTDEAIAAAGGHPSVLMLMRLWEVLDAVFARHGTSSNCMEKLCRCYKHTSRNCGPFFRPVVHKLLPQVTGWYEQQPHSCFLYMNNVNLASFGQGIHVGDLLPIFADSFHRMSVTTFKLLSTTAPGGSSGLIENPDVVDDYFELCGKVLRCQPSMLLESADLLPYAFDCGCAALHLHHREANRSALRFFDNMVDLFAKPGRGIKPLSDAAHAALRSLLGDKGAHLVRQLVLALSGALPAARVRFVAPLLKQLIEVEPAQCQVWVGQCIQAMPEETHADGQVFAAAAFSPEALADEKIFTKAADAFSEACRRRRGQMAG